MQKVFRTAAALLLAVITAAPALAQSLTGSITGVVKDEQGAVLPGVTITLVGRQGTKTAVTDAAGVYRFPALEVGTYVINAELSGFAKAQSPQIAISPGNELASDLTLKVGNFSDTITVTGESPTVDVASSATQTSISQSLLFSAPITRTAINVINYAPGINSSSAYGGGAGSGNALLIDGVDTRDPSGGTAWTFYNYNVVEEYQFQGLGAPAEYGGFTGAVVNTITKSGGNRFSGLFDFFGSNKSLGSNNVPADVKTKNPTLADPAVTKKYADITTQFGGPIKQNKLFFFASAQRFLLETDPTGPTTRRHEVSPRLNFKLTWAPNANNNFSGHLQYDAYNIIGRVPGAIALQATDELTNREDAPEYVWMTQYRRIFNSNTFAEVKYTGWWGFFDLNPETKVSKHVDENGIVTGSQGWFYYADRTRDQVNTSITHYANKFGRHELKFGAEFERSTTRDRYGYNNNLYFYDYGGAPYLAYSYGYDLKGTNVRQSVFAQDAWHATNRLTLNVGVRGDMYQGKNDEVGKVYSSSNWAPRLGAAFDLLGDNRTVLKGSYGLYYEGSQTQLFTRAVPGISDYVTYEVLSADYSQLLEIDRTPAVIYKMANDIKHPRVDEATLGFERAIKGDMRLSLTGIWRDNKNFVNSVAPDARWEPTTVTTDLNQPLTLYTWVNRSTSNQNYVIQNVKGFQYRNPQGGVIATVDPFRKYRAFMAVLNKRYTNRWQAQVSYVRANATGNVDNGSASQVATRQFESPNLALVNAEGEASFTPRHEFKLLGSYQIPVIETSINAFFVSTSGLPYNRIQQFATSVAGAGSSTAYRRIPINPRGTYHLPTLHQLDLRLEKNFTAPGSNRIGVYMDVTNLMNKGIVNSVVQRPTSVVLPDGTAFALPFDTPGGLQSARQIRIGGRWSF